MIEVIKETLYFKTRCPDCGTIFKYDLEDIEGPVMVIPSLTVRCPHCCRPIQHHYTNAVYKEDEPNV